MAIISAYAVRDMLKKYIDALPNDTLERWGEGLVSSFVDKTFREMMAAMIERQQKK